RWGWCSGCRVGRRTRGSGWPTPGGRGRSRGALGGVDAGGVVADEVAGFAAAAAAEGFGAAVGAGDGEGAGLAGLGGDGAADAGEEFLDGAGAELAVGGAGALFLDGGEVGGDVVGVGVGDGGGKAGALDVGGGVLALGGVGGADLGGADEGLPAGDGGGCGAGGVEGDVAEDVVPGVGGVFVELLLGAEGSDVAGEDDGFVWGHQEVSCMRALARAMARSKRSSVCCCWRSRKGTTAAPVVRVARSDAYFAERRIHFCHSVGQLERRVFWARKWSRNW